MTARIFKLAYQLRLHRVGGWALDRWAVTLAWGASVLILTRWAWRGQPALPAWHWLILALLLLSGAGGGAPRLGGATILCHLPPEPGLAPPAPLPRSPKTKSRCVPPGGLTCRAGSASLLTCQPTGAPTPRANMRCWPSSIRAVSFSWAIPETRMPGCGTRSSRPRRSQRSRPAASLRAPGQPRAARGLSPAAACDGWETSAQSGRGNDLSGVRG